ncbi:Uncharacterised protein [Chryseobacterium nakagawai]|uniref:Microcystin-dependent protein n=1 Tax=Chryseobacterium nakagawai TaxID=1241982 RepID=A0AAD0YKW3_CHRNA|nr:hypothetical protein [Chryseobacterium nakagawai]AZA90910.1 hypothetical protein EG343_09825 [Chryseobacterium nakagawai]VEH22448.1 Uncharacterised protein [Chryseobacterium nakagawai]
MKTFNFNETEGFDFGTKVLQEMQDAYSIIEGVSKMAGEKAIISGCEDLGLTISDGVVFLNGELLFFKGAVKQATVIIKEEKTNRAFENGSLKPFSTYRYATFGFSPDAYNWNDLKRVTPLNKLEERISKLEMAAAPIIKGGGRVLFLRPANEIPEGWEEDKTFSGRMPVGLDSSDIDFNEVGKTGGEKNHKLTMPQLPKHSFKIFGGSGINSAKISNNPDGTAASQGDSPSANEDWNYEITSTSGEAFAGKTNVLGNDEEHNNMSPFRIVIYIKFVG